MVLLSTAECQQQYVTQVTRTPSFPYCLSCICVSAWYCLAVNIHEVIQAIHASCKVECASLSPPTPPPPPPLPCSIDFVFKYNQGCKWDSLTIAASQTPLASRYRRCTEPDSDSAFQDECAQLKQKLTAATLQKGNLCTQLAESQKLQWKLTASHQEAEADRAVAESAQQSAEASKAEAETQLASANDVIMSLKEQLTSQQTLMDRLKVRDSTFCMHP